MEGYIGTILTWPITWAPAYWQFCSGGTLPFAQYQALYSLIGNLYGGNSTNFTLPDLRARVPVGVNQSQSALPYNTIAVALGGAYTTLTIGNLPPHIHSATFLPSMGPSPVVLPAVAPSGSLSVSVGGKVNASAAGTGIPGANTNVYLGGLSGDTIGGDTVNFVGPFGTTQTAGTANLQGLSAAVTSAGYNPGRSATTVSVAAVTGGVVTVGPTGSATPFTNYQPSLALNFIICTDGLYPSRPY